jgi:hypothetical protein
MAKEIWTTSAPRAIRRKKRVIEYAGNIGNARKEEEYMEKRASA